MTTPSEKPAIAAIVLAAGASRRMGRPKPLLPWGGTTILGQTLANLRQSRVRDIVVVTGAHARAVATVAADHEARAAHNPDWRGAGMARSVQTGLRALADDVQAMLVVLADQPMIGPAVVGAVIDAHQSGGHALVAPAYRGRRGHPVLFARAHFAALLALPANASPRALLESPHAALHLVDVDSEVVVLDLDTLEAYERWRPRE